MIDFIKHAWALLLGVLLLMVGNGMQGTLLGVRGQIEGFSTFEMSLVMSAYFLGFLGGSRMTPNMIRRVGHVRVFAALASGISAVLILYPAIAHPAMWVLGRVAIGFCFCGVYVTAESWLNNAASNENRGQALSLYMIVQMVGIVVAQALLLVADPSGYELFVIPSILVSISVAPILLSVSPTPAFDTTKPMNLRKLIQTSPLGAVGMFLMGGVFAAQFGMSAVFGASVGMTVKQIAIFVATFYVGATVLQYPLGWLSDRMDRRVLVMIVALIGGGSALVGAAFWDVYYLLLFAAFVIGGMSNPLYSLLIAHTNDFLEYEDMAAASGGLLFINGLGAILGPIATGWIMETFGPQGFFAVLAFLLVALGSYAGWRMTRRAAPSVEDTQSYTPVMPQASPVAVEVAQEHAFETAQEEEDMPKT
ncbi:MFS transporter [Shimia biformata]|uniref:MFS transporter n=1 Tax=Shimia biformata TaxID=1294299 RepID=UPI0019513E5F|nr:MFS transporter [Shimia biformata]